MWFVLLIFVGVPALVVAIAVLLVRSAAKDDEGRTSIFIFPDL